MLSNYSVKVRLLVLAVIPLACLALATWISIGVMNKLEAGISSLYDDRVKPLQQIKLVSDNFAVSIVDLVHKHRAGLNNGRETLSLIEDAEALAMAQWRAYLSTKLTDEEASLVRRAEADMAPVQELVQNYKAQLKNGSLANREAGEIVGEMYQSFDALSASLSQLIDLQLRESARFRDESHEHFLNTRASLVTFTLGVLVVLGLMAWLIYRSIRVPLQELSKVITTVAEQADLTLRVKVSGNDEIAETAIGFNRMMERLQLLIRAVGSVVVSVTHQAEIMSDNNSKVAERVAEQEQQTTMVATAITEMSAAVQEVAHNALTTAEKAKSANGQAGVASQKVTANITAINALSAVMETSSVIIRDLNNQSNEINKVVQMIAAVAEQTNLLALNAAIEAARAGESGRGFAVVADEVRQLAHSTRQATDSISEMIGKLQEASARSVSTMSDAKQKADESVAHAQESAVAIHEINQSIGIITDMNLQVSTATEEQTAVANEISENVNHFSHSVREISHSSEENALVSKKLRELANQLQSQIKAFQVV